MEFWGAEIKSGQPLSVKIEVGTVLHLSQACLGEVKGTKGNESVYLYVNIAGKKLVLGTLFSEKLPQQQFDLVFDKDFELSHNWSNGSVFFCGYKSENSIDESDSELNIYSESSEEELPLPLANNGRPGTLVKQEKPAATEKPNAMKESSAGKQKVKNVEPNKTVKPEEDDDSNDDSDDDDSSDDAMDILTALSGSDEDDASDDDDDDDGDTDESDDDDEETPKQVELGKKRVAEPATKTPIPQKKVKMNTPQKTVVVDADGKKGAVHVATPYPSKQAGKKTPSDKSNQKTPADKSNQKTPKSGASVSCKSCNKTFGSEKALESHSKAKHGDGK